MTCNLVLASASPRRREILENAGIKFTVRVAGVPEIRGENEAPSAYVERLAQAKALAVLGNASGGSGEVVLGADTTVVVDNQVLEKPFDQNEAKRMLGLLQKRTHQVITGFCLARAGAVPQIGHEITEVTFGPMTSAEIDAYAATAEPYDKAGAYAIQGLASKHILGIRGCYFNVVGLPMARVYRHLREWGCA